MITDFLRRAGMSDKEQEIYLVVLKHGTISCNAVADQLARERTSTYKFMMNMVSIGFLAHSKKQKTVLFSATSLDTIKQLVQLKHEELQKITDNMSIIVQEFQNIQ
jgi:predicted transcriptional regulator